MNGAEIAAIIAAVGGLLTAVFASFRALRGDKVSEDANKAATILTGLQGLVTTLQTEVARLNGDMTSLRTQCEVERREWAVERQALRAEHVQEMKEAYERMEELGSQLYVAVNRPPGAKTRRADKEIT